MSLRLGIPVALAAAALAAAAALGAAPGVAVGAPLVLDPGWVEGMSINTIEPSPVGEASANGRVSLDLGHVPAGQSFILWMQFQVNPTNIAWRRPQNVELDDGGRRILVLRHTMTVFP